MDGQPLLPFEIDGSDESFKIDEGGCVDECTQTLVTKDVKLDFHNNLIAFEKTDKRKLILSNKSSKVLFDNADYVMFGEVIDCLDGIMNVSFGGLRGEFKLSQSHVNTYEKAFDTREIYLYVK